MRANRCPVLAFGSRCRSISPSFSFSVSLSTQCAPTTKKNVISVIGGLVRSDEVIAAIKFGSQNAWALNERLLLRSIRRSVGVGVCVCVCSVAAGWHTNRSQNANTIIYGF